MLFFKKLWHLIIQCILLPISLFINMGALTPIVIIISFVNEDPMASPSMLLLTLVTIVPLSIALSKLLVRIKGKPTDENWVSLGVFQDRITTTLEYDGEEIAKSEYTTGPYIGPQHHHALTGWGFFAVITSVIAFPLRLIAVFAAFIGLFVRRMYTTHRPLPNDTRIGIGNRILHTLFDFVILPS